MKKYFFMAVAAIAALSSCSNNDEFEQTQIGNQGLVFTATMEGSEVTRATYDATNKYALWEVGDKISINGVSYSAQTAGATTTFKADGEDATGDTYHAYFPASLYNGTTATLPANIEETWADGKFNMPMYAQSETNSLEFKNLCGVLKITVTNTQLASVKCITVSSTNKAVSGAFTVDANNAAVLTDASKTANTVTVTYTDAVNTDATGKVFYVAIPAQTYQNLSIAVSDGTTTKVMTTKADQDITVARNTVYPISFDGTLTTTGTATRAEGEGTTDVKWIQLWAGGPKFAEYNVGAENNNAEDYGGYHTWADNFASSQWGSNWCMPTKEELEALINSTNCTVEWIDGTNKKYNNTTVTGLLCTGKGAYASNSVFLPAAGYWQSGSGASKQGDRGLYWSSTGSLNYACGLYFDSSSQLVQFYGNWCVYSVRAVLKED